MKCKNIIEELEKRWNPSWALDWDNVGLLAGREEKEVQRIFVALDVTDETLEQAVSAKADLIVTHHPLIFSPVKRITSESFIGRRLIRLIQNDICYYAMHTNFDVKGMADLNSRMLKLEEPEVLEVTGVDPEGREEGIGRIGKLPEKMSLSELGEKVKKDFQIPDVRVYGDPEGKVERIAVCSGSGKSLAGEAIKKGADVLITGDVDYHTAIDLVAQGLTVVDAGHYGTEYCFISYMEEQLKTMFPHMEVVTAQIHHPYKVL